MHIPFFCRVVVVVRLYFCNSFLLIIIRQGHESIWENWKEERLESWRQATGYKSISRVFEIFMKMENSEAEMQIA